MNPGRVRLLELDPDLAPTLAGEALGRARECVTTKLIGLDRGQRECLFDPREAADQYGLLILGGVLLHRLCQLVARRSILLGLAIWSVPGRCSTSTPSCSRRAAGRRFSQSSSLRSIGASCARRAPWPELLIALSERTAGHARSLALRLAISQIPQISSRVQVMLWQLADRFGRVDRDGVLMPVRLSHEVIAELVSARRETVSRRLKELAQRGLVLPDRRGWRLCGAPPPELFAFERAAPVGVITPGGSPAPSGVCDQGHKSHQKA